MRMVSPRGESHNEFQGLSQSLAKASLVKKKLNSICGSLQEFFTFVDRQILDKF